MPSRFCPKCGVALQFSVQKFCTSCGAVLPEMPAVSQTPLQPAGPAGIPVWCGGMLESGVGRAHNVAMSTLPGFTLPGDVSASKRYWKRDVIDPWVEVSSDGMIQVPDGPGFGYPLDLDFLASVRARQESLSPR